jgi:serine/threonine-protein kinase
MESWCHGAPGYVFLWTIAFRVLGESRYLELAERAATTTWDAPDAIGSLCCGDAGRAYALLAHANHGGGACWIDRAVDLAERADRACAADPRAAHALFKGGLGVALLERDLVDPERAAFPLLERDRRGRSG